MPDEADRYQFLEHLADVTAEDCEGLKEAQKHYGDSWKKRGGVGAFMMLARKWDRIENRVEQKAEGDGDRYDIFNHLAEDNRSEGLIDDIRDLRRYLVLVEAEVRSRGYKAALSRHRDNQ